MGVSQASDDAPAWLERLAKHVRRNKLAVLRLSEDEWGEVTNSRRGIGRFTVGRLHRSLQGLRAPTACVVVGPEIDGTSIHFGLLRSTWAATTVHRGLKVESVETVSAASEQDLIELLPERRQGRLRSQLNPADPLVTLGPRTSAWLVKGLARREANWPAMRIVERGITRPNVYAGSPELQMDAITTALKVFGVSTDDPAELLDLAGPEESTLDQLRISEDSVIEHDGRTVDGFVLQDSDLTGKAVFVKNDERLEVITANRRPLEELFGVDLIYVNATMGNIVMVQYKMLERAGGNSTTDWIYRPDAQFREEAGRMKHWVAADPSQTPGDYRINNEVFYLKFVKRDAKLGRAPIVIPMAHFEELEKDPSTRGPRGGFRVSFETLHGRYLRQTAFLDLIRSGYIGANSQAASAYTKLIEAVLHGGRGVVAALQSRR